MAILSVGAAAQTVLGERLEAEVLPALAVCLEGLTASSDDWLALLTQVYAPQESGFLEPFSERAEQIRQGLLDGSFTLRLELRSAQELQGNLAAYAAGEAGFSERILINADWAATASTVDLERRLLEELGHAFDQRLNLGVDTQGDEGQLFAARVLGDPLDPVSFSAISQENDGGVLQLDGQAVSVEFAADPSYNAATYDTDHDGINDASDLDDDNDGILDTVEAKTGGVVWQPTRDEFSYAQNTTGGNTTHDAAGSFLSGDINDPFNFFDGNDTTELRVHALDVYEFKLPSTGVKAGSSFTLREGAVGNSYDGTTMVLASLGTTDPSGNLNNAKGGGVGWKTISEAFGNVATPTALGALFTGTPIISVDQKFVLLYYGTSDQDLTLTIPIDVSYLQIVGIQTHGGWGDISVASQVDLTLDTDQDGIPNSRDLDSDNDGISDLYESVGSSPSASVVLADTDRSGTISRGEAIAVLTASGGWLDPSSSDPDYNKNGLWDFLDSSGATSANVPVDSDGDGVADLLDLDSDNDGIPDTVEARPSANYKGNDAALDPSGVRNNDADGDGVINLFDSNDASGATFGGSFDTPVNTDASVEGSVPTFPETGPPINATVDVSVDGIKIGDIQSILRQDTSYAEINRGSGSTPDMLVLDMGKTLSVGSKVLIRAQVNDLNGTLKLAQTDIAGNNPSNDTEVFFTTKNVYELIEYTITSTSTQYIRFMTNSRDRRIRIDTVSWGMGAQSVGQSNPDYLDTDSDEDTFLDRFESGLPLSGIDADGDGIDDAVAASYADPDGNVWTGASDPSGLQLGLKNSDSSISEYDYRSTPTSDDLFVSDNVTVNEASPWANFSISGSPGKQVFLRLNTLGNGTGFATDTSGAFPLNPADYGPTIQVLVGASWVNYTDASGVTLDGSGAALARVSIINDLSGVVHEGPEFYQLEASDASGVISSGGIGIIDDEGTGDVFLTSNTTDVPDDPSGGLYYDGSGQFGLDDDRVVQIDNLRINEGSPYAVFLLTGTTEKFTLTLEGSLQNAQWTATQWDGSGGALDASGLKDFGPSLEYWDASGSQWILYTTQQLTLPESGELLVRTPINQDLLLETDASGHGETFRLKATRVVDARDSSGGIGEILDTGAGSIYPGTVDASGKLIVDPSGSIYDDDTPIGINNVTVNEASKWAVFNLEGPAILGFRLSLIPGNQTAQLGPVGSQDATEGSDYGTIAQIEILNNSGGWDPYNDASGAALDSLGEGKVRVRILNDSPAAYEGPETYTLRATTGPGVISSGGLGVIVDDGTGLIFDPSSGAIDNTATKDDERVLDVSGGIYNEGSKWAVFIVKGVSGQEAFLDLSGNTATEWTGSGADPYDPSGLKDFGPNLQVQDASGDWNDYTPGASVFLDGSGNLKVRTRLYNDPLFETIAPTTSGETFDLIAISGGGIHSSGTATILDNGQGILLDISGNPDPSAVSDDDLPHLAVQGPANPVSEGSPLVFTVTMDSALPTDTVISLKLRDVTTETGDYVPNLNAVGEVFYFDGTGQVLTLKSAGPDQFTLPAGVSQLYVRVPSNFDEIYEGEEELSLNVGLVDFPGTDVSGSGFITDDGTGTVYDGIVDPSSGELGIDGSKVPDNDVPTLTITTLTPNISEGSVGFFSITLDKALETAAPLSLSLFPGPGTPEADDNDFLFSSSVLQVSWFEGLDLKMTRILLDDAFNGSILYPAGIQEIFVSVETVADDVYEGEENFTLSATLDLGLAGPSIAQLALEELPTIDAPLALPQLTADASANIVDDGTGVSYTGILYPSGNPQVSVFTTPDNDIPSLGVTSLIPEISEGSQGLFKIDLSHQLAFEAELNLQLRPGTAETDDYSGPVPTRVFFLDPGDGSRVFVPIDGSGNLLVPVGVTTLFAVVETTPDDHYDGDETFSLDALLNLPGVTAPSGSASALISDDGSAPVYMQDLSGNPLLDGDLPELDPSGTPDNDNPGFGITNLTPKITEGRSGLFRIDLIKPLELTSPIYLGLRNGTAENDDYGFPGQAQVYYLDPSGDRAYLSLDPSSGLINLPPMVTTLYVVVDTTPDDVFEGPESFFLDGHLDLPDTADDPSGSAGALIADDGSAPVYAADPSGNLLLDPSSGAPFVDSSGIPDDDRTLRIVGGVYNEASPYLFWLVEGNAGQPIRWVDLVGDPSGAEPSGDLSGPLQYRDASGIWQSLSAVSNPVLDASGELLIRKAVVNDDQSEGLENFSLTLEYPDGPRAIGVSSLINDGSGLIPALDGSGSPIGFDESGNPVSSQDANKDDDRALEVSGSTVNEASLFTFFKVDGAPGQLVTLSLNPGTAVSGSDYINHLEYSSDAGRTWTLYTPQSGLVSLNGEGTLLVRVPIINDQPPVDEPDETFQLRASGTGGTAGIGTATIVDGGNGTIYNPDGSPDPSGMPDDDALPPRLVPTEDGQGLKVIGQAGKSLWIDLSVTMADAPLQNGFDLIKVNAQGQRSRIGAIGATPDSGFLGDNRFQFVVGEELRFVQVSSDLPANSRPDLQITGTDNCALVGLDDDGGEGDTDDLALKVKTSETDPYPRSSQMARFQQGSELAYLDLSWIGSEGITLQLDVQTDADNLNTIGLVKVDTDASGNPLGTVAGVAPSAGASFDSAVRANLISYSYSQSGSQALKAPALTLTGSQAGVYAPVLFTEGDVIYTFGSNSSSDRRQHVKVLGANSFGFEDLPGLQADWDYNDAVVSFQIADPTTPRLKLSSNGQDLTVVAGTGPADGLWLDLNAILAEAGNQNSLDLFVRDVSGVSTQVGSVGATSRGTFLGAKELFLGVGETLTFVQNTNDNAPDAAPVLRITQIGDRYRVFLDDEASTVADHDFNDLVIDIDRTPLDPCEEVVNLAALQTSSSAGLLDLSTIGAEGLKLNLAIQTDSGNTNTLGFVKLDSASTNGQYSVDGVAVGNSEAFRKTVRENLIDFRVSAGGKGEADPAVWQLVAADAGIYAAVLLTPDNEIYTPGDAAAADGRQHLKVLGDSSFGFEDLLADKGSDFDFNDFVVKITPVT